MDRVAIITGAAKGLGLTCAERFATDGYGSPSSTPTAMPWPTPAAAIEALGVEVVAIRCRHPRAGRLRGGGGDRGRAVRRRRCARECGRRVPAPAGARHLGRRLAVRLPGQRPRDVLHDDRGHRGHADARRRADRERVVHRWVQGPPGQCPLRGDEGRRHQPHPVARPRGRPGRHPRQLGRARARWPPRRRRPPTGTRPMLAALPTHQPIEPAEIANLIAYLCHPSNVSIAGREHRRQRRRGDRLSGRRPPRPRSSPAPRAGSAKAWSAHCGPVAIEVHALALDDDDLRRVAAETGAIGHGLDIRDAAALEADDRRDPVRHRHQQRRGPAGASTVRRERAATPSTCWWT